jgi:hypothetical protein
VQHKSYGLGEGFNLQSEHIFLILLLNPLLLGGPDLDEYSIAATLVSLLEHAAILLEV